MAGGFILKLGHALQLAHLGKCIQQPAQLGVGRHLTLHKQGRAGNIQPRGQVPRGDAIGLLAQFGGVLADGNGVQVNHAEKAAFAGVG